MQILRGFYPEIAPDPERDARLWQASYVQTYLFNKRSKTELERDLSYTLGIWFCRWKKMLSPFRWKDCNITAEIAEIAARPGRRAREKTF